MAYTDFTVDFGGVFKEVGGTFGFGVGVVDAEKGVEIVGPQFVETVVACFGYGVVIVFGAWL